jgi:hypothetical protein
VAEAIVGAAAAEVVVESGEPDVTVVGDVVVIAAALSKGGSTESIDADAGKVRKAGASKVSVSDVDDAACVEVPADAADEGNGATNGAPTGGATADPMDGATADPMGGATADPMGGATDGPTDGATDDRTDGAGGGDATTSGSSISSSGKSGNGSSNGESGTPAKPLGTAGVVAAPVAGFAGAGDAPTAVAAAELLVEAPPRVGTVTPAGAPAPAGAPLSTGAIALPGALARVVPIGETGVAAALAVVETPPEVTPTGLAVFFAPVAAASEDDALRGAAPAAPETLGGTALPIGTPIGLGALVGTPPDDERATPGLMIPALEVPFAAAVPGTPGAAGGTVAAGALLTPRSAALLSDFVMSSDAGPEEPPLPGSPAAEPLGDAVPRAVPAPFVPPPRVGVPGSEAPNSTSGSINSPGAISVGTCAVSGRASRAAGAGAVELDDTADVSGVRSSNAPWASKSSSESPNAFEGEGDGGEELDAGGAVVEAGRAPPACDPVPPDPKGSSTGRSAKGSKAGREAASIIFEPQSGDQS